MNTKRERDKEFNKADREKEDKLIQTLCDFYGVGRENLERKYSVGKGATISKVRRFIFYKLIKDRKYTISEAGKVLKRSAWNAHNALIALESDKELMNEYKNVTEGL